MPTRAEITFIQTWLAIVACDDLVAWRPVKGEDPSASFPFPEGTHGCVRQFSGQDADTVLFELSPHGRELVATAKVAGIPEIADDEYERKPWEPAPDVAAPPPCPTCKGSRRVPSLAPAKGRTISELVEGEPAKQAVTLPGWDYGCPDCEDGTANVYQRSVSSGRTSSSKPNVAAMPRSGEEKPWRWQKLKGKWHVCGPADQRAESGDRILVRRYTGETKQVILRGYVDRFKEHEQLWSFDEVSELPSVERRRLAR